MTLPNRTHLRLSEYDYSSSAYYYVIICTKDKQCCFGYVNSETGTMNLSPHGKVVESHLNRLISHYEGVAVDRYVIMPNHIHMIVIIGCDPTAERSRPFPTLSTIIGQFKSGVSRELHDKIWQTSFYDHIIRSEHDYREIAEYIENNPIRWAFDDLYICQHTTALKTR